LDAELFCQSRGHGCPLQPKDRFDVCPGAGETVVYSIGTLYGEWIDGTPFEGNRYVDRFVVQGGEIVKMDVWNDSAERLLVQRGIDA
jgi:hypothetical protein